MKASNSLQNSGLGSNKLSFSSIMSSKSVKAMVDNTLRSPERSASFSATLISVVNSSEKLQECDANSIIAAALQGEGMNLSIALGQYSIVPYGNKANYQLSYKGLSQLAIRSGQYENFGVFDVREGEYKGRDKVTREPQIDWIEDEDAREKLPITGYYGFYILKDGFRQTLYWSHEKILKHADRYSAAFKLSKYREITSGKMSDEDKAKLRRGSPWYDEPTSEAHMKMCKKTILLQLLGDGKAPLSTETLRIQREIMKDNVIESGSVVIEPDDTVTEEVISATGTVVDESTGEVVAEIPKAITSQPQRKNRRTAESSAQADFFGE